MISVLPSSSASAPGVGLRGVGIGLDHPRSLPEAIAGELLGRQARPGEVWDATLGAGEARDALAIHRFPDLLADPVLAGHAAKHIRRNDRLVCLILSNIGRRSKIAVVAGVLVLLVVAVAAYAYDNSQEGKIADGVTIGGVDVGGMDEAEAKRAVRRELLAPLRHSLRVGYVGHSWTLDGKSLKVHADLDRAVEEAVAVSRDAFLPARLVRYVTGGSVDENVPAGITYSQPAVNRFVRHVAAAVDREARTRDVDPSGDSLKSSRREMGASCATTC